MMAKKNPEKLTIERCSFCGTELDQNVKMIANDDQTAWICEDCAEKCYSCFHEEDDPIAENELQTKKKNKNDSNMKFKPSDIKSYLDQYIIGQDHAKDILSVAVYNHYKIVHDNNKVDDTELSKSNILMLGSTGSGKTLLIQTLAKCLNVPLAIVDTSKMTAAGYAGADVETSLKLLIQNADNDIERAEHGIIYFDEFDKIAKRGGDAIVSSKDVGGEAVQQALLKLIEGSEVEVPSGNKRYPNEDCQRINTKNILFICGGSFEGIEKIIAQRLNLNKSSGAIGFSSSLPTKQAPIKFGDVISTVTTEDLKTFGLIPEIIGRLPIICTLDDLTREALVKIMKEPKNALCKQYRKLLKIDNVDLEFTDNALEAIADIAIEKHTGARGIRGIIEPLLLNYMKICPEGDISKIIITDDYVLGKSDTPEIVFKNTKESVE